MKRFETLESLDDFFKYPLFGTSQHQKFPPHNVLYNKDGSTAKIEVALAGYKPEDINIEFADGRLRIVGDKVRSKADEWVCAHHGAAQRKFDVAFQVNRQFENITASMVDGMLVVTLHKAVTSPKRIEIATAPPSCLSSTPETADK